MISAKMETTSEMGPSEEGIHVLAPQPFFEINHKLIIVVVDFVVHKECQLGGR